MSKSDFPDVVVIGNSPTSLLNKMGKKIDSFEKVIRVNKCVTSGYEDYIGKRTSIWSTTDNERWDFYIPDSIEDRRVWLRSPRTFDKMNNTRQFQKIGYSLGFDFIDVEILFKTPDSNDKIRNFFTGDSDQFWKPDLSYEPCTGLLTILRAIHEFKRVAILGFTFSTDDVNGGSFEYYRKDEVKEGESLTNKEHSKNQKIGSSSVEEGEAKIGFVKSLVEKGLVVPLNPDELEGIKIEIKDKIVKRVK